MLTFLSIGQTFMYMGKKCPSCPNFKGLRRLSVLAALLVQYCFYWLRNWALLCIPVSFPDSKSGRPEIRAQKSWLGPWKEYCSFSIMAVRQPNRILPRTCYHWTQVRFIIAIISFVSDTLSLHNTWIYSQQPRIPALEALASKYKFKLSAEQCFLQIKWYVVDVF